MTVKYVKLENGVRFDVQTQSLARELDAIDANKDGHVDIGDIDLTKEDFKPGRLTSFFMDIGLMSDETARENALEEAVVDAFEGAGEITTEQRSYLQKLFDTYPKAVKFNELMTEWYANRSGLGWKLSGGFELEVGAEYYIEAVLPYLQDYGPITDHNSSMIGFNLAFDIGMDILGLIANKVLYLDRDCRYGLVLGTIHYNPSMTSPEIASIVSETVMHYNSALNKNIEEIECEGDGCPDQDEFSLVSIRLVETSDFTFYRGCIDPSNVPPPIGQPL